MKNFKHIMILSLLAFFPLALSAQDLIKGMIHDDQGESIIGASVIIKKTGETTITDLDGNFSIRGKVGDVLSISYIGFITQNIKVNQLTNNKIVLKEDVKVLDEVVVVGMDKQKRNTITAAVASLRQDAIETRPVNDITSALQGNIAGLNFASDATSGSVGGEVGADIKFNIRGIGSINGGEPYVLVDGIEQSMQNVNPADIASISVLKDASAAAVYGARAAYGVVLVTTKSGSSDKTKISYRGTVGFSKPINMPEMMSSVEFAHYINERNFNMGVKPIFSEATIEKMELFMKNPYSSDLPGVGLTPDGTNWAGAYDNQYANTDWFDYYFKDSSIQYTHNLNITGGGQKVNYYVGAGYSYQEGLMDHVRDDMSKFNINTKIHIKAKDWLKFNFNNNLTLNKIGRPMPNQTIFYGTIANSYPNRPTVLPVSSEYDLPVWNEMLYLKKAEYKQNRLSDAMSLSTTVTPLENWDITADMKIRFDINNNDFKLKRPVYEKPGNQYQVIEGNRQGYQYPGMRWQNTMFGSYTRGSAFNYYLSPNFSTNYVFEMNDHFFKAMAGFQMEVQKNSNEFMYKDNMLTEDLYSFDNANGKLYAGENRNHWSTMGFYTRLNWNYKNIYFAEFSGRYDGSSRFAKNNRWGFFPSVSLGYDIARTDYFRNLNTPFSQFKIRVSYGRLGNQNGAGLYDYINMMQLMPDAVNAWLLPGLNPTPSKTPIALTPKMVSPYITWEKVDNANLGLDLMLLDNRLSVTADIYQRTTRDMLGPAEAIPAISGIDPGSRSKVNNATLRNRGWELAVNWSDKLECGFSYGVGFNVFDYKAVVTKYNNPEGILYNNHTGLDRNKGYYKGMNIGEIWGYEADDLFMSNREIDDYLQHTDLSFFKPDNNWQIGDLKYKDINGDGVVNSGKGTLEDHGDLKIIGNTTPRYSFGINLRAGYKGFEISTLLQGVAKRDFPMAGSTYLFGGRNYFKEHLDYFSYDNPNGYLPRLTDPKQKDYEVNTGYNTTRYLLNAAYMRMKNLTVSYTFDKKLLTNLGVSNLKLYVSCDNLFTISKLKNQFDPETINQVNTWAGGSDASAPALTSALISNGNGKVYPMNSNFVFGIDLTF